MVFLLRGFCLGLVMLGVAFCYTLAMGGPFVPFFHAIYQFLADFLMLFSW
jgi:hypothetical protein